MVFENMDAYGGFLGGEGWKVKLCFGEGNEENLMTRGKREKADENDLQELSWERV